MKAVFVGLFSAASAARIFLVLCALPPSVCSLLPSVLRQLLVSDASISVGPESVWSSVASYFFPCYECRVMTWGGWLMGGSCLVLIGLVS